MTQRAHPGRAFRGRVGAARAAPAALLALVTLAMPWPAGAGPARAASGECTTAAALLRAGESERARAEYVRVLMRHPRSPCAMAALERLNGGGRPASCRRADHLLDTGHPLRARRQYERLPPDAACRADGLAAARKAVQLCSIGRAERDAHRRADAIDSFRQALAQSPGYACALDGIEETHAELASRLESAAIAILKALAFVAGCLLLLWFIALLLGYVRPLRRLMLRRPFLGRLLGPRLAIAPFDDSALGDKSVGPSMAAQMRERLQRQRAAAKQLDYDLDFGGSGERLADVVSGSSTLQNALDKAKGISPQVGVIAAAIDLLYLALPIRRFAVSAVLDARSRAGAGLTLTLDDSGRTVAAVHLTGPPLDHDPEVEDYLALISPAAVWVEYELARALSDERDVGAGVAASFAWVREGLECQAAGDDVAARVAYEQALVHDETNWKARVNLAILEGRLAENHAKSIRLLRAALEELKRGAYA